MEPVDAQPVGASLLSHRLFGNERIAKPTGRYGVNHVRRSVRGQIDTLLDVFRSVSRADRTMRPLLATGISKLECLTIFPEWGNLPSHAEGQFVIPSWKMFAPTYGEAFGVLTNVLSRLGGFELNYDRDRVSLDFLRPTEQKVEKFRQIARHQSESDVYLVPAQLGMLRCGQSDRHALAHLEHGEFMFGAYEVSIILISHPQRMAALGDMAVTAPGDEISYTGNGNFDSSPFFCSHLDINNTYRIRVGVAARDGYGPNTGPVSGFWP